LLKLCWVDVCDRLLVKFILWVSSLLLSLSCEVALLPI